MSDWDDATAVKVAHKIIRAQQSLLVAYRTGGKPPESAIDYLMKNKQRFMVYAERPQLRTERADV
jgi:hypothetical protein